MRLTSFAVLETDLLCEYALQREECTEMEIELAQRLGIALDLMKEHGLYEPDPRLRGWVGN